MNQIKKQKYEQTIKELIINYKNNTYYIKLTAQHEELSSFFQILKEENVEIRPDYYGIFFQNLKNDFPPIYYPAIDIKCFFKNNIIKKITIINLESIEKLVKLNETFRLSRENYLSIQRQQYLDSNEVKEINYYYENIKSFLNKTQDYNKIVDNILNGIPYVELIIVKNVDLLTIKLEVGKKIDGLPNFEEGYFYFPYISGKIEDYMNTYKDLKLISFKTNKPREVLINISESLENFKNKELDTSVHDIQMGNKNNKNFKENYHLIKNYIIKNYPKEIKGNTAFLLCFNSKINKYFIKKTKNLDLFGKIDNIFYLENYRTDLKSLPALSDLFFNNQVKTLTLDIDKTVEKINIINTMENF